MGTTMDKLPSHRSYGSPRRTHPHLRSPLFVIVATVFTLGTLHLTLKWKDTASANLPINAAEILRKCNFLDAQPGPPADFHLRTQSDRFQPGTAPTLIRNATIWTGRVSGHEVVMGDLLFDKGIIQAVGHIDQSTLDPYDDLVVVEAAGAWVSPGIVDIHSHVGVDSVPALKGAQDTNSFKGLVLPWLRSLDGLNTHDEAYRLSISGGVTTSVVLPGSADAIGGQAFVIKLRPTAERSSSSMLLEPPFSLNKSDTEHLSRPRWRQMKHACGRVYSGTRMDTVWAFRQGYDTARKIKESQDEYCAKAMANQWDSLGDYPEDLQWEALVDVLRGRVKVHNHCYEATDLDGIVRLSNEFKFPIAAFHHAHETYLVPDLIKKAYGLTPAVALFATNARYKREAYRGSEFAPRILADNGLRVIMKSDHPVLNSRHLVYEAQQAHYYGLPDNLALAAVTSTPATVIGQDHRIGFIKSGYDADVIVWDSHPLTLGATPKQVYIDGIAQMAQPFSTDKPAQFQCIPKTPNFDKEAEEALKYDGLPPLEPAEDDSGVVVFTNVSSIYLRRGHTILEVFSSRVKKRAGIVVVEHGAVTCAGDCSEATIASGFRRIDLDGGSISPGLVSFGSSLGLTEIQMEASTNDGKVFDPLTEKVPSIVGGDGSVIQAVDGIQFAGRDTLLAYRAGVTTGIVAPTSRGFLSGLSTAFSTGAVHRLAHGAVVQDVTALHISVGSSSASISTQIAALRRLLLGGGDGDLAQRFRQVAEGKLPLVIQVQSADVMASLLLLKREVENRSGNAIRITFSGASEAHLLAKEIGEAGIGVILTPSRPFPGTWESRRILPGPPITQDSAVALLHANNVTVGVGIEESWSARNTRFDVGWAALEANGQLSKADALALASVNLEVLLGLNSEISDLVATKGGDLLGFEGKVISVISPNRGIVGLF
ncbi:hypothetical protein D9615_004475 [Tricholomella constricta]|uniref:Amidohydrolase-related domain-containing protein n=1 Tax=Tricholomella constricta TaxID=117010 RepID=A0A8H5HBW8_9AGAR|nr:hypothetical protein D9615_004475 [Tricholomella constricta]